MVKDNARTETSFSASDRVFFAVSEIETAPRFRDIPPIRDPTLPELQSDGFSFHFVSSLSFWFNGAFRSGCTGIHSMPGNSSCKNPIHRRDRKRDSRESRLNPGTIDLCRISENARTSERIFRKAPSMRGKNIG